MSKLLNGGYLTNFFSLSFGQFLNLLLNYFIITFSAKHLGVNDYGLFNSKFALIIIISKVIDGGYLPILFREFSKNEKNIELLDSAISWKIINYILGIIAINIILFISESNETEYIISNVLMLNILISYKMANFRHLFEIPFKVKLQSHIPIFLSFLDNLILSFLIGVMILFNHGLLFFIFAYVLSNLPGFFLSIFYLKKYYNYKYSFSLKQAKWLVKASLPILGFIVLDSTYMQAGILFLDYYHSDEAVGIYSATVRLVSPLIFVPTAVVHTLFPYFSRAKIEANNQQREFLLRLSFKVIMIFTISIFLIVAFKSEYIIQIAFGSQYIESAVPLSLLLFSNIFLYYNYIGFNLMVIYDKQILNLLYSIIVTLILMISNIMFVPELNYLGAAYGMVFSTIAGACFMALVIRNVEGVFVGVNFRLLIWAAVSIISFYYLKELNLIIYFIIAVSLLCFYGIIIKIIRYKELIMILDGLKLKKIKNIIIKVAGNE